MATGFLAGHITSCQGTASQNEEIQYFTITGTLLTANVTATASPGFLISISENANFGTELSIPQTRGNLFDTVYVRLAALADTGNMTGTITLTSAGVAAQTVNVSGNVLPTPVEQAEPDIMVLNGATIPELNFEGAYTNTYLWTNSNPAIGLAANGIDSLPAFRTVITGDVPVTATITVTPVWASMAFVRDPAVSMLRVINGTANVLDTTISVAGRGPSSAALTPDATRLIVLNPPSQNFSVINTLLRRVHTQFLLPTFAIGPSIITTGNNDSLAYVENFDNVAIMNINNGRLVQFNNLNAVYHQNGFAVNPAGTELYANGMADVNTSILAFTQIPSGVKNGQIITSAEGGPIAISPDTSRLAFILGTTVPIVNTTTERAIGTLSGPLSTTALSFSPDGHTLYVLASYVLEAYDMADFSLKWQVPLTGAPNGLAVSPDGTRVYLTSASPPMAFIVNTLTRSLIATIPLYNAPQIDVNTVTPGGCPGNPITFTITVNPAPLPAISENGELNSLTTVYGTPSPSENFTVSGAAMRGGVLVTPPPGFEVSLDGNSFSTTVTAGAAGTINDITVYIRIAATTKVGAYTGHIVLTSPGAANVIVDVPSGTVTPASLVVTANDQKIAAGAPIPPLTLTYTGFVNGDGVAQLVYPPVVSTTATRGSPAGTYPITVRGAYSTEYNISYVPGVLTIISNVAIPNAFTPNGDGINDTWDIQKIEGYPNCTVKIFDRYGQMVFSSTGYSIPWDGTSKGSPMPTGTYYYIINLNASVSVISGFVALLR